MKGGKALPPPHMVISHVRSLLIVLLPQDTARRQGHIRINEELSPPHPEDQIGLLHVIVFFFGDLFQLQRGLLYYLQ